MKNSRVLVCCLSLIVVSVLGTSATAQEVCDPTAATTVQDLVRNLKQEALADLQDLLQNDIGEDFPEASDTLARAIVNLTASLTLFERVDPCTVTADEAEVLFNALDEEEFGIELVMDLSSEAFLPDGPLVDKAEAAVRKTLAGDEALVVAFLSRLPGELPPDASGSGSDSLDPDAALAEVQAAQDACRLPERGATRETDGTCDEVSGGYADIIGFIIEFI